MDDSLLEVIQRHKAGDPVGIYSVCSANRFVLEASMMQAINDGTSLLIESTSNQVDQYGGYTGMTPLQFRDFVSGIAQSVNFPMDKIILGGDHLGPNSWQNEPAAVAMEKAEDLIRAYVSAGFQKIHLDTSMRCADDPGDSHLPFDTEIVAERAARLCRVAESAARESDIPGVRPLYVIGTDVPIPGGAQEKLDKVRITSDQEVEETIAVTRDAFRKLGLSEAWNRVIAVVVQPGVEFGDTSVIEYQRSEASVLSRFIGKQDALVYEAHSTDYQTRVALRQMVEDHFAILKVGPWLTFALREAIFSLSLMEEEWIPKTSDSPLSRIREQLEKSMTMDPAYWQKHYHGSLHRIEFARRYSYSDRIRYYWPETRVQNALTQLIMNLEENPVLLTLLSQFMPVQYLAVREGHIKNHPLDLIRHKIMEVTDVYSFATGWS